jgi:hypothetical protein
MAVGGAAIIVVGAAIAVIGAAMAVGAPYVPSPIETDMLRENAV